MSRINAFYLLVASGLGNAVLAQSPNPDELYRQRENMAIARQAADIWAARAAGGQDFEAAWKLAKACYWIGTHDEEARRRPALERGVAAGEQAVKLKPDAPEGHFWMAANMGALAESFGLGQGLKYRGRIRDELQRVLAMDPAWQQGSADRALGWWYHMVPGLFGGSEKKAEEHLRKALSFNPKSTATLYFLAEVLLEAGKKADAKAMFQQVLDVPDDPDWIPEDRDFKQKAAAKLKTVK
ncbi:MAG TPA: TRAP transporter TatT component family protein [Vicinamibacterales bacterium]